MAGVDVEMGINLDMAYELYTTAKWLVAVIKALNQKVAKMEHHSPTVRFADFEVEYRGWPK